jgi:integrase
MATSGNPVARCDPNAIGAKVHTMVFKAFDNDLISGDTLKTFRKVKKLARRGSDARDRILTMDEYNRLQDKAPLHLKGILAMGYYTGMRKSEILGLTWGKVDLKNRVIRLEAKDTKDREPRVIPICDELYEVLRKIPRDIRDPHVFSFRGKPVNDIRAGLREACKEAGIVYGRFKKGGFVFHDLRHTFNTNMRKAGIPESVIMAITGHSTREMFDRYNTIDHEDTRAGIEQLSSYLKKVTQTVTQKEKTDTG